MLVTPPPGSAFTIHNIPFGVFSLHGLDRRVIGTAIGAYAVDIAALIRNDCLSINLLDKQGLLRIFSETCLNDFMQMGQAVWREVRGALIVLFSRPAGSLPCFDEAFFELSRVQMHLPCRVGDYTDFYASKEHACNVGEMFRGKDNALMPNWLHLPVGYHGRASSIVVSGTEVIRPSGQIKPPEGPPRFSPSLKLDFELEMGFVIGVGNDLGKPIKCADALEHIFGVVLLNDWSARDIQAWEYVPLGPFLGKSFGTTISPWIVTMDALEPFLVQGPTQSPPVLEYLQESPSNTTYNIELSVKINDTVVCRSNLRYLYWSFAQQLAHHTVNGCNMRSGDICGTGTISGSSPEAFGSLLELSWNGTRSLRLADGSERTYLQDGDTVQMTAVCENSDLGISLGFGECIGTVLPAHDDQGFYSATGRASLLNTFGELPGNMDVSPGSRIKFSTESAREAADTMDARGGDKASFTSCQSRLEKGDRRGLYFHSLTSLNEASKISFECYKVSGYREAAYLAASWLTLGLPWLLVKWWPQLMCQWRMRQCDAMDAEYILARNYFSEVEIVPVKEAGASLRRRPGSLPLKTFTYRFVRYFLQPESDQLISLMDIDPQTDLAVRSTQSEAYWELISRNRALFGTNSLSFLSKSYWQLFIDEIAHPFNVFQIVSVLIWLFENYYLYSCTILLMSTVSIALALYETQQNNKRLHEITRFHCRVKVLSGDSALDICSTDLVPGHVLLLDPSLTICPCDMVLIRGDAIVDESMLTGESVPVSKTAIHVHSDSSAEHWAMMQSSAQSSTLYSGTRILRARSTAGLPALAVVTKTGFLTLKGQLVRSILYPKPVNFAFYSDSMKYVLILGVIAIFGFLFSLYTQIRLKTSLYYIISRALDLITVVVPPALPATMSIGTVFSLSRLKKRRIHCISPSKINVASKIDVFCFDKTGTLTEEGLDFYGTVPCAPEDTLLRVAASTSALSTEMKHFMACCHSLQRVDGLLVGDPLDVKMFESSGWALEEHHNTLLKAIVRPIGAAPFDPSQLDLCSDSSCLALEETGIIRWLDFSSELRRMSVLTKSLGSDTVLAYCKGSPESIVKVCSADSVPDGFEATLLKYSKEGFRVIACARRSLGAVSWLKAQKVARSEVECDMEFLGFLLFENKVKRESASSISRLAFAQISTVMVTGDNLQTSVSVARSCGLVSEGFRVFVPASEGVASMLFVDSDSSETVHLMDSVMLPQNVVFGCTGDYLKGFLEQASHDLVPVFVKKCKIYARMSPEDKKSLVELMQSLGLSVGFCGDGANDCGALKVADIGISLSESEASVAAPFSSNCKNVSCVISVLLEGRAALATSLSCFKFMALYSMIQFFTLILLYCFGSSLGDYQFVVIDLLLIVPLGMLMSRFEPSTVLVPQQPNTKLVSAPVLVSLLSQIFLQAAAQTFVFISIILDPQYPAPQPLPSRPNIHNHVNSAVFLFSNFLYLSTALVFCSWRPFRSLYAPFYLYIILGFAFNLFLLFGSNSALTLILELMQLSLRTRLGIVLAAALHLLLSSAAELLNPVFIAFVRPISARRRNFKEIE